MQVNVMSSEVMETRLCGCGCGWVVRERPASSALVSQTHELTGLESMFWQFGSRHTYLWLSHRDFRDKLSHIYLSVWLSSGLGQSYKLLVFLISV